METKIIGYTLQVFAKAKDLELVNKVYNYTNKLIAKEHKRNIKKNNADAFNTIKVNVTNVYGENE